MTDKMPASLRMTRDHMNDIPHAQLPDDFSFHLYQPGDELSWLNIWQTSEANTKTHIDSDTFVNTFFADTQSLTERQYYILDPEHKPIATSTAWFGENDKSHFELGRVHWIAIVPAMQGRGLARPLLTKTLQCLQDFGHEKAFLYTDTLRIPAIALYLKYGFRPDIYSHNERNAWQFVQKKLRPDIAGVLDDCLA